MNLEQLINMYREASRREAEIARRCGPHATRETEERWRNVNRRRGRIGAILTRKAQSTNPNKIERIQTLALLQGSYRTHA